MNYRIPSTTYPKKLLWVGFNLKWLILLKQILAEEKFFAIDFKMTNDKWHEIK